MAKACVIKTSVSEEYLCICSVPDDRSPPTVVAGAQYVPAAHTDLQDWCNSTEILSTSSDESDLPSNHQTCSLDPAWNTITSKRIRFIVNDSWTLTPYTQFFNLLFKWIKKYNSCVNVASCTLHLICSEWSSSWWSGSAWESWRLNARSFSRDPPIPFSHLSQSCTQTANKHWKYSVTTVLCYVVITFFYSCFEIILFKWFNWAYSIVCGLFWNFVWILKWKRYMMICWNCKWFNEYFLF